MMQRPIRPQASHPQMHQNRPHQPYPQAAQQQGHYSSNMSNLPAGISVNRMNQQQPINQQQLHHQQQMQIQQQRQQQQYHMQQQQHTQQQAAAASQGPSWHTPQAGQAGGGFN